MTGGTGKIGRHLVSRLISEGAFVKVISRSEKNPWDLDPHIEILKLDLLDEMALRQVILNCDYVFHLAVHQDTQDRNIDNFKRVNVDATKVILSAAGSCRSLKKIIYVSTAMIFESTPKGIATEAWPQKACCQGDYYLETKIQALQYVRRQIQNLPIVIVYPTAVIDLDDFHGSAPAKPGTLQYFLWEKIGGGIPGGLVNLIGPGKRRFNYVMMENLVDGLVNAALRGEPAQEYILSGHNIEACEYLKSVSKRMKRKSVSFRIPVFFFKILSLFGRFIKIPEIINIIANGDYADRCFSFEKARRAFGYEARLRIED